MLSWEALQYSEGVAERATSGRWLDLPHLYCWVALCRLFRRSPTALTRPTLRLGALAADRILRGPGGIVRPDPRPWWPAGPELPSPGRLPHGQGTCCR